MDTKEIFENTHRNSYKTYTMQFRFLSTVIFAMLAMTFFVGGISIYEVDNYIREQAQDLVNLTCEHEGIQINATFDDMEKSVKIMESYVMDFFSSVADVEDQDLQKKIIKSADAMFVDVAKHTRGTISYYMRFDPAISDGKSGLFYSKEEGSDEYIALEPTDILRYEKDDIEHVGWFWQPYEAGTAVWMQPYHNQNNNRLMISYVIPMYYEEKFVGVVGMDFDYMILANRVHEIEIYENGFAHLELDGVVIHNNDQETGAKQENLNQRYLRVSKQLVNGMTLVISASYDDIQQIRYEIAFKIVFAVLLISCMITIIVVLVVKRIVEPIKKITDASVKLSKGDYDVEIIHSNTHEIKLLSTAFEDMIMYLREREKYMHLSANRDSLTGLRNTNSYKSWVAEFNKKIESKNAEFGVVVFDVNYLKETNDKYGHDAGNEYIVTAAKVISDIFKRSPVFRVGGDEFVVVLQHRDLEEYETLFVELDEKCANTFIEKEKGTISISIARGFARFDMDTDVEFMEVFKRADNAMYENKRKMKTVLN